MQNIAIYGAGGFAREVAWLVESCSSMSQQYSVVGFVDDNESLHEKIINDLPIFSLEYLSEVFPDARVIGGIGNPLIRQKVLEKTEQFGFHFITLIHPNVEKSKWIKIDTGTVICAGNILTTNITIGKHVQINLDCTIGHDVIMEDYVTLAPGVHVSGWVHFEERVYVGTGANIINGTREEPLIIGQDAIVGAGACVTKSVPPRTTVVGVPAKPLGK